MNTQDVFERAHKTVELLHNQIQTLEIQREEVRSDQAAQSSISSPPPSPTQDVKTVQHMEQVNLKKYQVTTVEDALAVLEEAGETVVRRWRER